MPRSHRPRGSNLLRRGLRRINPQRVKWGKILSQAVTACVVIYVGLVVFHLTNGFDFTEALRGGFVDVGVTASCFGDWGTLKQFVDRETLFGVDLIGRAPSSEICP